jgi:hypothetical protein
MLSYLHHRSDTLSDFTLIAGFWLSIFLIPIFLLSSLCTLNGFGGSKQNEQIQSIGEARDPTQTVIDRSHTHVHHHTHECALLHCPFDCHERIPPIHTLDESKYVYRPRSQHTDSIREEHKLMSTDAHIDRSQLSPSHQQTFSHAHESVPVHEQIRRSLRSNRSTFEFDNTTNSSSHEISIPVSSCFSSSSQCLYVQSNFNTNPSASDISTCSTNRNVTLQSTSIASSSTKPVTLLSSYQQEIDSTTDRDRDRDKEIELDKQKPDININKK